MAKRYSNFDGLRGLATIAVILIHITAPMHQSGDLFLGLINQACRFAVPVFLILSSWGLDHQDALDNSKNYLDFLKQRLTKLVPYYLVWSLIYLALNGYMTSWNFNLAGTLQALLLGQASYHLYFIPLIIGLYIFYPILSSLALNKLTFYTITAIYLVQAITDHIWGYNPYDLVQDYVSYTFCFLVGIRLSQDFASKKQQFQHYKSAIYGLVILTLVGLAGEYLLSQGTVIGATRPLMIAYAVSLVLLAMVVEWSKTDFLTYLSRYSYSIYLSHVFWLQLIEAIPGLNSLPFLLVFLIKLALLSTGLWLTISMDQILTSSTKNQ